jgi:CDP-diglyceride synthetase
MEDAKKQQIEKRNLLSSFFVTLLIALAYQEMIVPVRESVRTSGMTLGTFLLMTIFFVTTMRFFVGNQLHLLSESLVKMPGLVWFYDLMVIIIQSVVLTFLGGVSSVEVNRQTSVDFIQLLIILYVIDVAWIISQWILGKILPKWRRAFIPWAWAILNSILVICMVALGFFVDDKYSTFGIIILFVLNFIGFIVDVVLVDYYDALKEKHG